MMIEGRVPATVGFVARVATLLHLARVAVARWS
jgi:hypothetical protein